VEEGVHEGGEAAAGVDPAGEGVEEVEEDWLGDGAEALGGGAEVGEGGLGVMPVAASSSGISPTRGWRQWMQRFWLIWVRISVGRVRRVGAGLVV
jgi:hypothetical protein